jgi:UDP-glucose 4-epimerase
MSSPKILVTGGTGFIGRCVVERLRSTPAQTVVTTFGDPGDSLALDLTDEASTKARVASVKPDIVLHLGGVTGAATDAERCHAVNYLGTVNLLNALESTGVSRVVLIGTAAEYGRQATPFREDMPLRPVSPYAVSKAKANEYALELNVKTGLPVTILRVFTAYGYGQPAKMFLSQLIESALAGSSFDMSDGRQKRDFIFVEDVVDAVMSAMTAELAVGRVMNIAQGRGIALRDLAVNIWRLCGADPELLRIGAIEKASDDAFDTEADITLAGELLDWAPSTPFIGDAGAHHPLLRQIDRMRRDLPSPAAASVSPLNA